MTYTEAGQFKENTKNGFIYNNLSVTANRYRVICRATAAIFGVALKDMRILNGYNILERERVGRERETCGQKECHESEIRKHSNLMYWI